MAAAGGTIRNQPGVVNPLSEEVERRGLGFHLDSRVEVTSLESEHEIDDLFGLGSEERRSSGAVRGDQGTRAVLLEDLPDRVG